MENVRINIPQLPDLDQHIEALQDRVRQLKHERQELIDAEARRVAVLPIGHEFKVRNRTYRVTSIKGDHSGKPVGGGEDIIWVRYHGVALFKNGKIGPVEKLYIPEGR